jgi:pimeloyl-ACP methyl ester carboxylesterase
MDALSFTATGKKQPVVVLLHGFCESKKIWEHFIPALSKVGHLVIPDLPGFGDNKALEEPVSMEKMADEVYRLLQELQLDEGGILVGHSMGGYVSLAFAERYGHWMKGLCLFHSTALADTEEKKETRNKTIDFLERNGMPAFTENFIPSLFYEKNRQALQPAIDKAMQIANTTPVSTAIEVTKAMRDRKDRTQVLKEARYPVKFIAGKEDQAVPFDTLKEQFWLPQGTTNIQVFPETAHMGMFEREKETLEGVMGFIKTMGK